MTPVDDGRDSDETQVFRPPQNPPTDRAWGAVDDPLHDPVVPPEGPNRPVNPTGVEQDADVLVNELTDTATHLREHLTRRQVVDAVSSVGVVVHSI